MQYISGVKVDGNDKWHWWQPFRLLPPSKAKTETFLSLETLSVYTAIIFQTIPEGQKKRGMGVIIWSSWKDTSTDTSQYTYIIHISTGTQSRFILDNSKIESVRIEPGGIFSAWKCDKSGENLPTTASLMFSFHFLRNGHFPLLSHFVFT